MFFKLCIGINLWTLNFPATSSCSTAGSLQVLTCRQYWVPHPHSYTQHSFDPPKLNCPVIFPARRTVPGFTWQTSAAPVQTERRRRSENRNSFSEVALEPWQVDDKLRFTIEWGWLWRVRYQMLVNYRLYKPSWETSCHSQSFREQFDNTTN